MMMPDKIFIDTNILVYLVNEDSPFRVKVEKKFREIVKRYGSEIYISRQVLREYAVVMTKPGTVENPLSPEEVICDLERWNNIFQVLDETEGTTQVLMELIKNYGIKGKKIHDANIVATMVVYSIKNLFTLNVNDFKMFEEIHLVAI